MKVITVEHDEGFATDERTFAYGEVAVLSLPCPGNTMRSGGGTGA